MPGCGSPRVPGKLAGSYGSDVVGERVFPEDAGLGLRILPASAAESGKARALGSAPQHWDTDNMLI